MRLSLDIEHGANAHNYMNKSTLMLAAVVVVAATVGVAIKGYVTAKNTAQAPA